MFSETHPQDDRKVSYALYVFHWPIIIVTSSLMARTKMTGIIFIMSFASVAIVGTYAFAHLSWRAMEKRLVALFSLDELTL
jgi:peptidoglycan/LPS O-acetylase OafA/YrhL